MRKAGAVTVSLADAALYAGALLLLFLTPGPAWVALVARAMSGGFRSAWPLALGVSVGDAVWPLVAILGVSWLVSAFADLVLALRWTACLAFLAMGGLIIWNRERAISADGRLTRPGMRAGFVAGIAVILGNPKAALFYMGVLPGFFGVDGLAWQDIALICLLSALVPLAGNVAVA